MRLFRIAPVMLCFIALCSGFVLAQAPSRGTIAGVVEDGAGSAVPNATVTLRGPRGETQLTTDDSGAFLFPNLNPGRYTLRAELTGFGPTEVREVTNRISEQTFVRLILKPAEVAQGVDVILNQVAETPIDATSAETSANIPNSVLVDTPVGHNVSAVPYLAAAARSSGAGRPNPSIAGASGLENMTILDGSNFTSPDLGAAGVYSRAHGALGTGMNFDFVEQVEVKTSGFEAQYGQALGGVINIVTKSGGSELHGGLYQYYAPNELEASPRQPNAGLLNPGNIIHGRADYALVGEIGGSVGSNRFFWYGAISPTWTYYDIQAPPQFDVRGKITERQRSLAHSGKLSFRATPNHQLEASYFGDPSRLSPGPHRSLARNVLENIRESDSLVRWENKNATGRYDGTFGNRFSTSASLSRLFNKVNETNFSNVYEIEDLTAVQSGFGPRALSGGIGAYENSRNENNQFNWFNGVNFDFFGKNRVEFGYSFEDIETNSFAARSGPLFVLSPALNVRPQDVGTIVWGATLRRQFISDGASPPTAQFVLTDGTFSAAPPDLTARSQYQAAFLENTFSPGRRFTLKLGVRWEQQELEGDPIASRGSPDRRYTFTGNWSPRVGFTIDPMGTSQSRIFFSYGHVYDKLPTELALRGLSGVGSYLGLRFSSPQLSPATYLGGGYLVGGSVQRVWPGTKAPYQREYSAGAEHAFTDHNVQLGLRFVRRDLMRVVENIGGVTVEQLTAGLPQNLVIGNPRFRNDFFGPGGSIGGDGSPDGFVDPIRRYYAWEVSVEKRFEEVWQMIGSYRWSRVRGNYEGLFRNDTGEAAPNMSSLFDFVPSPILGNQYVVGDLPTDRRHVATFYLSHTFPEFGWNLGLGSRLESGAPITRLGAHPAYLTPGEIPVGGRGTFGRTAVVTSIDGHADYTWNVSDRVRLRPTLDVFNLLNHQHVRTVVQSSEFAPGIPNADFGSPAPMNSGRSVLAYQRPIHARLSLRLEF